MGKSNKFDYTNRANSGAKLGQIIGHALEKEAEKLHKDADKQGTKSRKVSTGSEGSIGGNEHLVHVLDIKAPGKQLGDEGVCALAGGLESALRRGDASASLALEDLNLSDNGITTKALARLAPIVVLAKHDLKTINLSNNRIRVETVEEARQWEAFLRAFRNCFKLRRLDFGNNESLGAKALEIFFRIHLRESSINPLAAGGEVSVHTLDSVSDDGFADDESQTTPTRDNILRDDEAFDSPLARAKLLKRRCGLRSIPYITLSNVGLDDAGALWLSHTLEDHHYPNQLVDELNATLPDSNIKVYQQEASPGGIDWAGQGSMLGKDGLYLLKHTEAIRAHMLLDDPNVIGKSLDSVDGSKPNLQDRSESVVHRPTDRNCARTVGGPRRVSIRSIRTNDGGEHETSEIESTRKKIQRAIIAQHGACSVDLWRAALKAVVAYRVLVFSRPPLRSCYHGPPLFNFKHGTNKPPSRKHASPKTPTRATGSTATYASTLLAQDPSVTPGEPELVITDVTNTPRTPKVLFKPHRKGGFSEGSDDIHTVSAKLEGLVLPLDADPQRFVRWQERRRATRPSGDPEGLAGDRDLGVPSHLPLAVIDRIVDLALVQEEREALTATQRMRAYAWARDRGNFESEREWRKMADSAQVWTLLESIGCLNYEK